MSAPLDRVVVSGMGLVSAAGSTIGALVESLQEGVPCVRPIIAFDSADMTMTHAGEVPGFNPCQLLSFARVRTLDRGSQFSAFAAKQALEQAGLTGDNMVAGMGVAIGTSGAQQYQNLPVTKERNYPVSRRIALYSARSTPVFQADLLARLYDMDGPRLAFGSASLGGLLALSHAMDLLQSGHAPAMLVGGGEYQTLLNALGMDMLGLSTEGVCTPFSEGPGMCFGDGAAFLVVETLKHAQERGARPLGELVSCGISADAYDGITNDPSGKGLCRAVQKALKKPNITPSEIAWVRACGSGHRTQDTAESIALNACFSGAPPPVTSTEPYFGHVNGVSPLLGTIVALTVENAGVSPRMPAAGKLRAGCELPLVSTETPLKGDWLLTAVAFGGGNGALVGGQLKERPLQRREPVDIRVAGMGVVSPLGNGLDSFIAGLANQTAGSQSRPIHSFRVDESLLPSSIKGIRLRRRERLVRWGLIAAVEALKSSYLGGRGGERTGLLLGLTRGPAAPHDRFFNEVLRGEFTASTSRSMLKMSRFSVASELASALGLKGYTGVVAPGVHGGVQLLAHGTELLKASSDLDELLVIGVDEWSDLLAAMYDQLKLIDDVIKPYDPKAAGTVGGEGAAALLLVKGDSTSQATDWGRISGSGFAGDTGVTPDAHGLTYARAISQAIDRAGVSAADISFTLGQGCGWPAHDSRELAAIAAIKKDMPLSSVQAYTGMAECTGGLFSAISALVSLREGRIPPVALAGQPQGAADFVVGGDRLGDFRRALVIGSSERGSHGAIVMDSC